MVLPSRLTRISTRRQKDTRVNTQNEQSHGILQTPRQKYVSVTTKIEIETVCRRLNSPHPSTTDTKNLGLRQSKSQVR